MSDKKLVEEAVEELTGTGVGIGTVESTDDVVDVVEDSVVDAVDETMMVDEVVVVIAGGAGSAFKLKSKVGASFALKFAFPPAGDGASCEGRMITD